MTVRPGRYCIGGVVGGVSCGVVGWFAGTEISEKVYDWIFKPLEKEEWIISDIAEKGLTP